MGRIIFAGVVLMSVAAFGCDRRTNSSPTQAEANQRLSESRMKQLMEYIELYTIENGGRLPKTLDDLKPLIASQTDREGKPLGNFTTLMTNPITGARPGYVYRPPAVERVNDIADPMRTPLLYEADATGKPDAAGAKGYADFKVARPKPGEPTL